MEQGKWKKRNRSRERGKGKGEQGTVDAKKGACMEILNWTYITSEKLKS